MNKQNTQLATERKMNGVTENPISLETLKRFCGDDETRPQLMAPWTWGEFTYATDGRVLVRTARMPGVATPENEPAQQARILAILEVDTSDGNYVAPPQEPVDGWGANCETCNGTGRTDKCTCPDCDCVINLQSEIACLDCDGAGRKLWAFPVNFGFHLLNAFLLRKMAVLPGVLIAQNSTDANGALSFRFDGGDGRLMPMKKTDPTK